MSLQGFAGNVQSILRGKAPASIAEREQLFQNTIGSFVLFTCVTIVRISTRHFEFPLWLARFFTGMTIFLTVFAITRIWKRAQMQACVPVAHYWRGEIQIAPAVLRVVAQCIGAAFAMHVASFLLRSTLKSAPAIAPGTSTLENWLSLFAFEVVTTFLIMLTAFNGDLITNDRCLVFSSVCVCFPPFFTLCVIGRLFWLAPRGLWSFWLAQR